MWGTTKVLPNRKDDAAYTSAMPNPNMSKGQLERLRMRLIDDSGRLRQRAQEYRHLAITTSKATAGNLLAIAPTLDAAAEQLEAQIKVVENLLLKLT
jgi:hypothetical protein